MYARPFGLFDIYSDTWRDSREIIIIAHACVQEEPERECVWDTVCERKRAHTRESIFKFRDSREIIIITHAHVQEETIRVCVCVKESAWARECYLPSGLIQSAKASDRSLRSLRIQ